MGFPVSERKIVLWATQPEQMERDTNSQQSSTEQTLPPTSEHVKERLFVTDELQSQGNKLSVVHLAARSSMLTKGNLK